LKHEFHEVNDGSDNKKENLNCIRHEKYLKEQNKHPI